jgi:hypothetical protein
VDRIRLGLHDLHELARLIADGALNAGELGLGGVLKNVHLLKEGR